jgi:hypothetical protein
VRKRSGGYACEPRCDAAVGHEHHDVDFGSGRSRERAPAAQHVVVRMRRDDDEPVEPRDI